MAGSSWVTGPESRLIRIVLQGVRGEITVDGVTHNREMIGFGLVASDAQIAAILTYVRGRWAAIEVPVKEENVGRIRRDTANRIGYWTVEELLNIT